MAKKSKSDPEKRDLEYFLGFGWYQGFHFLLNNLNILTTMTNMSFMVYAGMFPKLNCDPVFNHTATLDLNDDKQVCAVYQNNSCANFSMHIDFNSIASEVKESRWRNWLGVSLERQSPTARTRKLFSKASFPSFGKLFRKHSSLDVISVYNPLLPCFTAKICIAPKANL